MENAKKYRVAIYCRVGNPDDADTALEMQKKVLRKYASAKGYEVTAEISEAASGLSIDRDGIRKIIELAERQAMDEVLAVGFSRYSRNVVDMLRLKNGFEKKHIKLNALKEMPLASMVRGKTSV